ncbi:MAG TPA: hypothetical protein VLB01_04140 [Thermodesulfobacteriota bacterium]|nr:hypothetical protein [Thermodesulfobacteriota bacterium]
MVDNDDIETRLWDHYLANYSDEESENLEIEITAKVSEVVNFADTN